MIYEYLELLEDYRWSTLTSCLQFIWLKPFLRNLNFSLLARSLLNFCICLWSICSCGRRLFDISTFDFNQFFRKLTKELMNIAAIFGWNFDIRITIALGILFSIFLRYLPITQIWFVSNEKDKSILSPWLSHKIEPFVESLQGRTQPNVKYD